MQRNWLICGKLDNRSIWVEETVAAVVRVCAICRPMQQNETPFGKWTMIMVVLHPAGDPKDMKNMVGALKAPL